MAEKEKTKVPVHIGMLLMGKGLGSKKKSAKEVDAEEADDSDTKEETDLRSKALSIISDLRSNPKGASKRLDKLESLLQELE